MSFSVSDILRRTARSRPGARTFAALAVSISGIVAAGYLLLFAASFSPEEKLRQNITAAHSRGFFSENYPQYFYLRPLFGRLDMYTECVGIGIAVRPNDLLRMPTFGDCPGLTKAVGNNFAAPSYDYMRYSHGHQIFLKPLYAFFSLETTRAITALTTFVLLLALFFVLKFRLDTAYAAVVALSFFFTSSPSMFFTVTHGVAFWLVLAGAITATLRDGKTAPLCLFGCIGACDAFLNFFVMCSLSLALPLLCYVLAQWAKGEASDQVIANAFWGCVGWSIGFVAPWLIKWAMLMIVYSPTREQLFGVTLDAYPSGGFLMILTALGKNFLSANWPMILIAFALCARHKHRFSLKIPDGLWVVCLPALVPLFWICILPGHSGIKHSAIVNIILWPGLAAICLLLLSMPRPKAPG